MLNPDWFHDELHADGRLALTRVMCHISDKATARESAKGQGIKLNKHGLPIAPKGTGYAYDKPFLN